MRLTGLGAIAAWCLLLPTRASAQNTGRIECARNDEYVYLYGSLATLQVRGTGKDAELVRDTTFTVLVDEDIHLKREDF